MKAPGTSMMSATSITALTSIIAITAAIALSGCGPSTTPSVPPKIAARVDVIVTLDGGRHSCVVALYNEPQGSIVPCSDVVPFIKDELRVAGGAVYDVRTIPEVDKDEMARVVASLNGAGYRFIGGRALIP
jgi:hypothetical protein